MTQISTIIVFGFFAVALFVGWRAHHGRGAHDVDENFLIGNRAIPGWMVAIGTMMGWIDAFQFRITPALAFDLGWASLAYIAGVLASFLFLMLFAAKVRRNAAQSGAYMMGNYFSRAYSPRVSALIGIVMTVYFFIWLCVQFTVGAGVIGQLTHIPTLAVGLTMGTVALAYMLMGGFLASIRTDLVQFFIFIVFAAVILFSWAPKIGVWAPPLSTFGSQSVMESLTMFVLNVGATVAAPDVWQRVYSARSDREARGSMGVLAVIMTLMLLFFLSLGLTLKGMGLSTSSGNITQDIFARLVPGWFMPFAVLTFVAVIMATIATCVFGTAMTVGSDVLAELRLIRRDQLPYICRRLMAGVLVAALAVAFLDLDVMALAFTSLGVTLIVLPLLVLALFGVTVGEPAAFWSLVLSAAAFAVGAWYNIYTGPLGLAPLGVSVLMLLVLEGAVRAMRRRAAPA